MNNSELRDVLGLNGPVEIVGGRNGYMGQPVEIIGDRAIAVAEVDKPSTYLEGKYTAIDRIDVGFGDNAVLGVGATTTFTAMVSTPFKPEEMVFPSWLAPFVSITNVDIGPSKYVDGGAVPADIYSEVSTARRVSWGTVQTSVTIRVTVRNDSPAPVNVKFALRGLRLK